MLRGLKRILFPTVCPVCGSLKHQECTEEEGLCPECAEKYLNRNPVLELPSFIPGSTLAVCPAFYGDGMKEAMKKYKFGEETYIGQCFGTMIYKAIISNIADPDFDLVTCVPVSEERFAERGFNQSEEIAKKTAKLAGIPFENTLTRKVQGRAQSSLLTEERQEKEGMFSVSNSSLILNKHILLTDDIITTGSTLSECTDILLKNGAASVAVAAAVSGRREFM